MKFCILWPWLRLHSSALTEARSRMHKYTGPCAPDFLNRLSTRHRWVGSRSHLYTMPLRSRRRVLLAGRWIRCLRLRGARAPFLLRHDTASGQVRALRSAPPSSLTILQPLRTLSRLMPSPVSSLIRVEPTTGRRPRRAYSPLSLDRNERLKFLLLSRRMPFLELFVVVEAK